MPRHHGQGEVRSDLVESSRLVEVHGPAGECKCGAPIIAGLIEVEGRRVAARRCAGCGETFMKPSDLIALLEQLQADEGST